MLSPASSMPSPGPVNLTSGKPIYDRFVHPFFIGCPHLQKALDTDLEKVPEEQSRKEWVPMH